MKAPDILVSRVAMLIDQDAWAALTDGRDGPGTLWYLRREWSRDKAEQIVKLVQSEREPA